jgi:Helicase conserved C-terminal domain/WYL domain
MSPSEYELIFDLYSSAALQAMAKARNAYNKQTRKVDILAALVAVVEDEASVRAAYAALGTPERALLAVLRDVGGAATVKQLKAAAARMGIGGFNDHLNELMRRALVLYTSPGNNRHELWRTKTSYGWHADLRYQVRAVPPALALADATVALPPLNLAAVEEQVAAVREQSPSALLHGLFTAVRWAGGRKVKVAKSTGMVSKNDLRSLAKQLSPPSGTEDDWAPFLCALALSAKLLHTVLGGEVRPTAEADAFFKQPPREQVRRLYAAWQETGHWSEFFRIPEIATDSQAVPQVPSYSDVPSAEDLRRARAFLSGLLERTGKPGVWNSLASLIQLVKNEDEEFLISRQRPAFMYYSSYGDDNYRGLWKKESNSWRGGFSKSDDWELVEGRYIRQVLADPLHWLGLVATGHNAAGEVIAFRLTPLGAHVLGLEAAPAETDAALTDAVAPSGKALIVQPNFEIIAYTEPEHLSVLFELEKFAERLSADRVAHYRLTKQSVYSGLQEGLTASAIHDFLARHSQSGVPQNIAYSLDDWQRLHDRVQVRRSTTLIEAESEAELDALLANLPASAVTRLSPTWAVLEREHMKAARWAIVAREDTIAYDYELDVSAAFTVTEQLRVCVPRESLDLLLRARIEQFAAEVATADKVANPETDDSYGGARVVFQITPDTLKRAKLIGVNHREVMAFLESYAKPPLPADVLLTLKGWGGEIHAAAFAETVVFVTDEGLLPEIAAVDELRDLLWLKVSDRVALVKAENVAALQAALGRRGIGVNANASARLPKPSAARPGKPKTKAPPAFFAPNRRADVAKTLGAPNSVTARNLEPSSMVSARPSESEVPLDYGLTHREVRANLEKAIQESRRVVIEYRNRQSGRQSVRKVDPVLLADAGNASYLYAWCHWRQDYREFRLERIVAMSVLEESYDPLQYAALLKE